MARRFFYVCAGLFLLAVAYALGARSAGAQPPGNPIVTVYSATNGESVAILVNGDVYTQSNLSVSPWAHRGNIFGGATPALRQSWGQVKARYR